jgi:hypothetical protein
MITGDFTFLKALPTLIVPIPDRRLLPPDDRSGGKMGIAAETSIAATTASIGERISRAASRSSPMK